ncbi:hypothetical protein O181_062305 [Austropuccinia psidii MF-1]|uniref:Elongator complex protein 5 n=1 Tax=Austropuccinia psidii MF-1 TaxID=1389203 RepID=A0A9Q3EP26_9BASI|nr:hypothetical protein [Austropuccinia psidii MF-1]
MNPHPNPHPHQSHHPNPHRNPDLDQNQNRHRNRNQDSNHQLILNEILLNSSSNCSLIVVEDSLAQSGLKIFKDLINHSIRKSDQNFILLSFFNSNFYFKSELNPIQSIQIQNQNQNQSSNRNRNQNLNLNLIYFNQIKIQNFQFKNLISLDALFDFLNSKNLIQSEKLTIFIDSIQDLISLFSFNQTFKFFRNLIKSLPTPISRLIALDSPHLSLIKPSNHSIHPSTIFQSTSISPSILHLKIHPTSLFDHLFNQLNIPFPRHSTNPKGTHYDPRLFSLINQLTSNLNPYHSSPSSNLNSINSHWSPTPQALLIQPHHPSNSNLASVVIEWTAKNLSNLSSISSTSIQLKSSSKSSPISSSSNKLNSFQHGLEALKINLNSNQPFNLIPLPLISVLSKKIHLLPSNDHHSSHSIQDQLTFNLSLTDKQKAQKDAVQLPFLPRRSQDGNVIEAPGEIYDGSSQKNPSKNKTGLIWYEPDSADDMDDEEPDDEL